MKAEDIKHDTWPLPNLKPIKAADFWHHASIWTLDKSIYVQAQHDQGGGWFHPVVYFVGQGDLIGGGFVVKCFYSGQKAGQQEFFRWSECDHVFGHESGGNCYHIYTCSKCGGRYDVDSSD